MKPLILIIEDDPDMRDYLCECLHEGGYQTVSVAYGESGLRLLSEKAPALVILDVMLAGALTGWEVCRQARLIAHTPILMVTSLAEQNYQAVGLNLGADDYVVKPISPRHLLARVQALLRRTGQVPTAVQVGPIYLDEAQHEVMVYDSPVNLTRIEFKLLGTLLRRPDRVFSRAELLEQVWDPSFDGVDRVVDVHLSNLRRKLGRARGMIRSVRGVGYLLTARSSMSSATHNSS